MQIKIGEYLITSDSMQFIVKEIGIVQEGRFTKAENVGKEKETVKAYCTKFEEALRFIPQEVLRVNDDTNIIMDKLNQIKADIEQITEYPVIKIDSDEKENNSTIEERLKNDNGERFTQDEILKKREQILNDKQEEKENIDNE